MFSPQGYPNGKVVYDFSLSQNDEQYYSMYDLEPYRQTFAVFALTSYKEFCGESGHGQWLEEALKRLRNQYPAAIMHKIFVFGVPKEGVLEIESKHIFGILSSASKLSSFTSLETAMCDVTSDFLAELAVYVISRQMGSFKSPSIKGLDAPPGVSNRNRRVSGRGGPLRSDAEGSPGAKGISSGGSGQATPTNTSPTPPPTSTAHDKPYNVSIHKSFSRQISPSISSNLSGTTMSNASSYSNSISITKTGSISLGLSDRTKSKQHGRMIKFLGNMYLLAGRLSDALKEFTEAATILKTAYDHLWYGSALEGIGICLVLQSFLEVPVTIPTVALHATLRGGTHNHTSSVSHSSTNGGGYGSGYGSRNESTSSINGTPPPTSPSPSPEGPTMPAPLRTSGSDEPPRLNDFLPDLTDAVIRFYNRTPTSSEDTIPQIVYCETILRFAKLLVMSRQGGGWNGAVLSAIVRGTPLQLNITSDSPSAASVAAWCNKIYSTGIANLPIPLQVRLYSGLASLYSGVGLHRKRAFVLREMVLRMVGNPIAAETGVLQMLDRSQKGGIIEFLDSVCRVFSAGEVTSIGSGWLELRLSFLKSCISICESISHYQGVVYFISLLFSTMADSLDRDEQLRLFSSLHRAVELSRKSERGPVYGQYWDPYMLRDIKVLPPTTVMPTRFTRRRSESKSVESQNSEVFLYNPYSKSKDVSERVLVQGERVEFSLKIQNPFEFEVHVNEITLLTKNVELIDAKLGNVFIPGSSVHDLFIVTSPKTPGELIITGCKIEVSGCHPEEYQLSNQGLPRLEVKLKTHGINSGIKRGDIDETRNTVNNNSLVTVRELKLAVLPSQPLLLPKNQLSLEQTWVMVLEGEKKNFTISLSNQSNTNCKLVNFGFVDSTTEPLQATLADKDLPLNEVYECEYFLYKRRALQILNSPGIGPHETGEYDFQVSGKRGLTSAVINLDYGVMDSDESEKSENTSEDADSLTTWVRRITVPVNVTVNPSIELSACDIIPLTEYRSSEHPLTRIDGLLQPLEPNSRYFILVLDLRNAWSQAMNVKIWSKSADNKRLSEVTQLIYPSRTSRFLLPIKWEPSKADSEFYPQKPIPTMSRKQYVVDQNLTPEQVKLMTETFWYREQLLSYLGGEWEVDGSTRTGSVELRGIRLSRWMVTTLRTELVKVSMNMFSSSSSIAQVNELTWQVDVDDDQLVVRSTIFNGSDVPISGILRLVPSLRYGNEGPIEADEIHKKIIYNGVLQRPVLQIMPGQSVDVDLGIIVLLRGEYEWTSMFEVADGLEPRQYVQREPLFMTAI
ncbi:Trs120p [Sugiyamaella lignohabitans]|uniref:Trs120p n=1 Tax=Sugiyamaella lignohabitans TaxID=796027 RepID=A0A161HFL9_9ASCO|nr:Trs120p [Sugiyamaella lignohabitans]ANB14360.1 Trs120p [Sugiyamaella lignohabitans]